MRRSAQRMAARLRTGAIRGPAPRRSRGEHPAQRVRVAVLRFAGGRPLEGAGRGFASRPARLGRHPAERCGVPVVRARLAPQAVVVGDEALQLRVHGVRVREAHGRGSSSSAASAGPVAGSQWREQ